MIARLILMLALLFSTLPAPAAAAPACHDAAMAEMGTADMAMDHAAPAPVPEPDRIPKMGNMLCVGCIAPATLRVPQVESQRRLIGEHGAPPLDTGLHAPAGPPETPPPRA
ncbi:hypothetical protein [Sphingomonas sp. LT1P40]|uniref:hypothetical protein n=1 Tax=Alteristakelama amylovorans TaxID=3096166 RepID=UPI002FC9CEE4